ncbi:alpha/beta fold hydrolase [Cellulomonas carbonis]|uniref:alpha/beta fold hydrolase n=1 Tax=Cellulomonas carbonis TaxID=1386092 RepID=UPI000AA99739|nr:alpha/beta hydrolase [Cellulomonas carbonis]
METSTRTLGGGRDADARRAGPLPPSLPVVLLHGARTSGTMWRAQLDALARAGRTAVAPDLPGHGRRMGERFTVDGSLEAIGEAVDAVGGRAVVVGLSLGGYLGIRWAADHPDGAAGLLASGCCTEPDRRLTDAWRLAAVVIGRLPDRGARLNQLLVDLAIPDDGGAALGEGGFALDVMVDLLTAMRALRPLDDLSRVRCPVRFVNGSLDHFRLQERAFLAAAPGAERVLVAGATHLVALTHPVAYNRALLDFLDTVDPARPHG